MPPHGNNATPPGPAEAPGVELIDPVRFAAGLRVDPRLPATIVGFDAPFFQAGLAGYSDGAMRIIAPKCRERHLARRPGRQAADRSGSMASMPSSRHWRIRIAGSSGC